MKSAWKSAIVAVLVAAVAATYAARGAKRAGITAAPAPASPVTAPTAQPTAALAKPRILEIGSMRCQACLEMAKVLDALRASQGEKLQVDFIDVYERPEAGETYKISLIPTQILFDQTGKEIFRHTGFFSHDDVLAKFRALGVRL
jgi:thioredoxin 1